MYKLGQEFRDTGIPTCIWRLSDNASIPLDPANSDYQQYLKWLEEGGEPLPADEQGVQP
jgi:hypothetical protein